jgi:replication-associated recombination protein RarA
MRPSTTEIKRLVRKTNQNRKQNRITILFFPEMQKINKCKKTNKQNLVEVDREGFK